MPETVHRTEFELGKLAALCLKRWWIVIGSVLAGFLAALLISTCLITPLYRADTSFYISAGGDPQAPLSASDLAAAGLLADTCIGLLDSDTVLDRIALLSETDLSAGELREHISADRVKDTSLLRVSVLHRHPDAAVLIAEAAAQVLPATAEELMRGCCVQVVDHAKIPTEPDSPDIPKICILGAFSGLILSAAGLAFSLLRKDCIREETPHEQ